jgi:hypothetical protein
MVEGARTADEREARISDLLPSNPLRLSCSLALSTFTPQDFPLYRRFFARDRRLACYGNSCTYIAQACRGAGSGLGLKYFDGDVLLSIGVYRGHYVVVRPLGRIDDRLLSLLQALRDASGKPVFLKKLFPDQVRKLERLGEFHPAARRSEMGVGPGLYPWDEPAFADDDTYPELIVHVDLSLKFWLRPREWLDEYKRVQGTGPERPQLPAVREWYRKFRRGVRKSIEGAPRCRLEQYHTGMADEVRSFLIRYFGPSRRACVEAYEAALVLPMEGGDHSERFAFVAYQDEAPNPVGFLCLERLDERSAGSYARAVMPGFPGLPEYLRVQSLLRLQEAGIQYLNVGGSECRGLHVYKRQLAPIEQRHMEMLVYGVD